jgi:hypothetical protein
MIWNGKRSRSRAGAGLGKEWAGEPGEPARLREGNGPQTAKDRATGPRAAVFAIGGNGKEVHNNERRRKTNAKAQSPAEIK